VRPDENTGSRHADANGPTRILAASKCAGRIVEEEFHPFPIQQQMGHAAPSKGGSQSVDRPVLLHELGPRDGGIRRHRSPQ
jgi:hypothetical protein